MEKWYKRSKWRNLVDMHIPDWNPAFMTKFDPVRYAELMETAGTDACELYTGNCLGICFFPTKAGHMHAGLQGEDIVGPTLEAITGRGKSRIAYFNIWSRWAYDTHPGWRLRRPDGTDTTQNAAGERVSRFGQCCINNPGYREYVAAQITQICTDYDFESMWIDMIGWGGSTCVCDTCRAKFFALTGHEIPEREDWTDPVWIAYQEFRKRGIVEMAEVIRHAAYAVKPGVTFAFQAAPWQGNWTGAMSETFLHQSDFLAGDFYGNPLAYTAVCKGLNALTADRPIEFMTSRCYDLNDHTSTKSPEELRFSACASLAHNGAFVFIDAIDPAGTMDGRLYAQMGKLRREMEPFYRYWDPDAEMLSDAVFYLNFRSNFDPWQKKGQLHAQDFRTVNHLKQIAESMIAAHVPYDFASRYTLEDAVAKRKLIVLPEVCALDEEEAALLRDFVRCGGRLVVTGQTGLYGPNGRLEDFALADVLGVKFGGFTDEDVVYFAPECREELFEGYGKEYPLMLASPAVRVEAKGAEVLASLTLPWSGSKEIFRFGSAISNPPGVPSGLPGITLNRFGEGLAMYIAAPLEKDVRAPQKRVFANLIRFMLQRSPLFETDTADWAEPILYADTDGAYRLFMLNAMEKYYKAHTGPFTLRVRVGGITRVTDVGTGEAVPFTSDGDGIVIRMADFCDFLCLRLERD